MNDLVKNKIPIKHTVPLVSATIAVFVIVVLVISYNYNLYLNDLAVVFHQEEIESQKMRINSELMETARTRTRITNQIINTDDLFEQDELNMKLDVYATRFAMLRKKIMGMPLTHEEKNILEDQEPVIRTILPAQRSTVEIVMAMDRSEEDVKAAREKLFNVVLIGQGKLIFSFGQLITIEQQRIAELTAQSQLSLKNMKRRNNAIIATALIVAMSFSIVIILRIQKTEKKLLNSYSDLEQINACLESKVEERTKELSDANDKLNMINNQKDKLFSILGHDLRGAFTPIKGLALLIKINIKKYTDDEIIQFSDSINDASDRALILLEGLLDWARSQMDGYPIVIEPVNVRDLAVRNVELYESMAIEKGCTLECDVEGVMVLADVNALDTIIRNLVSNAIKFTDKGSIRIGVELVGDEIKIYVKDSGVGMDEQTTAKVFDDATYLTTRGTNNEVGTGLGLLLCHELVLKQNGRMYVESQQGVGSTFYFMLPKA